MSASPIDLRMLAALEGASGAAGGMMMRLLAALAAATGVDAASDGLARRPMRGWNSWNWVGVAGCDDACAAAGMAGRCHSEVVMRQMTDVVAGGKLKELDYEYINLSEGWPAECFRTHNCTCVVCRSDPCRSSALLRLTVARWQRTLPERHDHA